MIIHSEDDDPDRGDEEPPPVMVATIAGADLVTLAALQALQEDYMVWQATEGDTATTEPR